MPALQQAFAFETGQDAAHRRARDAKFARQLLLAEAGTRLIFDETDAVANGVVDAFEALARQRQWPVVNIGSKAHPASRTAWRNCLVRSFLGLPKNSLG